MIDTIRLNCDIPLRQGAYKELRNNRKSGWTFRSSAIHYTQDDTDRTKLFGIHAHNDLRVGIGDKENLLWVEVSLPRLCGDPNGVLLKTPQDLSAAISILLPELQALKMRARLQSKQFTVARIDLVLNLPIPPKLLLPIHKHARHPKIRRETAWYFNQDPERRGREVPCTEISLNSVVFNGAHTRISMYNKRAQVRAGKLNTHAAPQAQGTRVEIKLTEKKHIAKLFGYEDQDELLLSQLRFDDCYRVYRDLLLQFPDVGKMPLGKPKLENLLALLASHPVPHPALGGVEVLDWYRHCHSEKSFMKMRCNVAKLMPGLMQFHWPDHLPEDRLPDIVDVDAEGNESIIPSPFSCPQT